MLLEATAGSLAEVHGGNGCALGESLPGRLRSLQEVHVIHQIRQSARTSLHRCLLAKGDEGLDAKAVSALETGNQGVGSVVSCDFTLRKLGNWHPQRSQQPSTSKPLKL